ncbi:MAG: hypothetical protein NT105_03430 [Verrucomicrobia bacterium]|nr:hypothetical protein [Verrucomicrobiota bacterium]
MNNAKRNLSFIVAMVFAFTCVAGAGDPTAFEMAKMGNQYVGVQSKDKVVQIRSEKSVGSLTPNIWYVVYYDPDATFKAVEVKVGAGQKLNVSHPLRVLEMANDKHMVLDKDKLRVDSDRALKIATSQPLLHNLTLKASKLTLGHGDEGPVWRVQLWAAKLKDPNDDADIGVVVLSATDGSVVKADLHPNRVD